MVKNAIITNIIRYVKGNKLNMLKIGKFKKKYYCKD